MHLSERDSERHILTAEAVTAAVVLGAKIAVSAASPLLAGATSPVDANVDVVAIG